MNNQSPSDQPAHVGIEPSQVLLSRANLAALGIKLSNSQLLRLEAVRRFPRRLRLSAASVCWDRQEVEEWLAERRAERAGWHYAAND
jgi:predicted DNA-binding transcriptional regulator AlpA